MAVSGRGERQKESRSIRQLDVQTDVPHILNVQSTMPFQIVHPSCLSLRPGISTHRPSLIHISPPLSLYVVKEQFLHFFAYNPSPFQLDGITSIP